VLEALAFALRVEGAPHLIGAPEELPIDRIVVDEAPDAQR
jgi:hypothetical protein